ncbi:MAG: hypothetical protein KDB53_01040, partial [Planctomycetes bacterium]|nr:hypothetical protein [Planctomycetota bacterium]
LASSQFAEGAAAFQKMISMRPDSRFLGEASIALARCQTGARKFADVGPALSKLRAAAEANKDLAFWLVEAAIAEATGQLAAGQASAAATTVHDAASAVKTSDDKRSQDLWARAKRLEFEAHLAAKDPSKAKIVQDDLKQASSRSVFALAAERNCRAETALSEKASGSDLHRVAKWLGDVHVENFEAVSQLPRTCYLLGLVHLELAGSRAPARETAKGYFEEVRRRFPETREAFLARDQLKKM